MLKYKTVGTNPRFSLCSISDKANSRVSHLILSPYHMKSIARSVKGRYGELGVREVGHSQSSPIECREAKPK